MILVDVNLLIYAVNEDAPQHERAKSWLESVIVGPEIVAFPWIVLLAFLRLTTRQGLFVRPLPLSAALDLIADWLNQSSVIIVHPGVRHLELLGKLLIPLGTAGNLTSDAHLAALAIENHAEICSLDGDFVRFAGVRWRNPLLRQL